MKLDRNVTQIRHQLEEGAAAEAAFTVETGASRFIFPLVILPETGCKALRVGLRFEAEDTCCRFPFNIWVRAGALARLVRVIEIDTQRREATFTLPVDAAGQALIELDCDAGIFDGANWRAGRRIEVKVALCGDEVDTAILRPVLNLGSSHYAGNAFQSAQPAPRPVFVVGMYRSGTSILTWALGQHPNIWAMEETGFLPMIGNAVQAAWVRASSAGRSFADVYELSRARFEARFADAVDGLMHDLATEHAMRCMFERANECAPDFDPRIQMLRTLGATKRRWVDGTPENIVAIAQLHRLFPEARFIHIVRDPVDVVASMMYFERIGGDPMAATEAARLWHDRVSQAYLAEKALGSQMVMRINFADLAADPRAMLNRIFAFLGEPAFDRAGDSYEVTINSSRVSRAEREEAFATITESERVECLRLYQELSDGALRFDWPLMAEGRELQARESAKLAEFLAT